jgi:alkanesulfonate monooxygenase SsuD/methylene tetrahydromethanopterin reductase-like flavin-dependent oxidoreductase (luciferase family)
VAQVDAMSGGRVELGLGTGWFEPEHDAYGVPFQSLGERFDRLTEQLDIVTGLWITPQESASPTRAGTGRWSTARPAQAAAAAPPAGDRGRRRARRTPRLAARFADEFNMPFASVEATRGSRACPGRLRGAGRDPAGSA